ncbi:MAG: cytochrome c-type biogenesis protein CcmH [Candidatus Binatia bacterium]
MLRWVIVLLGLFYLAPVAGAAQLPAESAVEEQARILASELRCPVCQNLSVGDSPSEMAQQMRAYIHEELRKGKTPAEIKSYFVSKYGDWVLLAPPARGFSLLLWVLPYVALALGLILVFIALRRWSRKSKPAPQPVDPALLERVRRDFADRPAIEVDLESAAPRSSLLREQAGLYQNLQELDFDYQAGKLSEVDYRDLRQRYEEQAAIVLGQIDTVPPEKIKKEPAKKPEIPSIPRWRHGWALVGGGLLILVLGVTLGLLLAQSLRPRGSEGDTMTGDFLTGTGPGGISPGTQTASAKDVPGLLAQGRAAFEKQQLPVAIDAFKKVLAAEPNQAEAHGYMGLILAQAGHYDGALMAFEKALSVDPNLTLALWGKGMLLYRVKQDLPAARQTLEKLLPLLPAGEEKNEVQKTLLEINLPSSRPAAASTPKEAAPKAPPRPETPPPGGQARAGGGTIQGIVTIDAKMKSKLDGKAVLFIIARSGGAAGGPPLAVKKIERPVFPLTYTLGQEDVMMQGMPLSGKVAISVRLDADGNAMTRQPGDLIGEYKNNPVEVGNQKVDIVIDRAM